MSDHDTDDDSTDVDYSDTELHTTERPYVEIDVTLDMGDIPAPARNVLRQLARELEADFFDTFGGYSDDPQPRQEHESHEDLVSVYAIAPFGGSHQERKQADLQCGILEGTFIRNAADPRDRHRKWESSTERVEADEIPHFTPF
jgi:hypothetical protein